MSDRDAGGWAEGEIGSELASVLRADAAARERIETDLDTSFLVEAAAGTGKTTVLVDRLVRVLASGRTEIDRVVGVTFTRKAAGELKLRLREALDAARERAGSDRERRNLADAIARLEEAHIGTIHSFCAELLRERPVEAGIDPGFVEIDAEESGRLYDRAFDAWIQGRLQEMPPGLSRALSRLAVGPSWDGSEPLDRLRNAGRELKEWRDYPEPWSRREWDRAAHVDALVDGVGEVAGLARACDDSRDPLRRALTPTIGLDNWIRWTEEASGERDLDAVEARLLDLARELRWERRKGRGSWPVEGVSRARVVAARDELLEALEEFRVQADADLAALLRQELVQVVEDYEELKAERGQLDFLDLLVRTRDLLVDSPAVRAFLQERFSHVFVDEFQDTDPLQVEILLLLTSGSGEETDWRSVRPLPGKLFLVGDPKQSIYRFRRADVVLYQEVKRRLASAGVEVLELSRSFRSVRPLQATVNAAFAAEMELDEESGQPEYVALAPHRRHRRGQPATVVLPVPEPYGWRAVTNKALEEGQPDLVADWVRWLLEESRWRVADPEDPDRDVPVEPRHVAILFRRFQSWGRDVTRAYTAALEARDVPHVMSGGRSFHEREEVETLRAALTAIEWPDDDLAVYATLKGSLFAIPDAALLRFRRELGTLHPFRPLERELDDELEPIRQALGLLAELHRGRNRVPIARTLGRLLDETRAHAGFALRPAGHQVLANVQRVLDMARGHELRGGLSFRSFVQRLAEEAERGGSDEAPVMEEGAEGVRIMTVHGAKGLEFPVVILADITAKISHSEPSSHVDPGHGRGLCATRILGCSPWELVEHAETERRRDRAEGVRLAYVAATRARDVLAVPAIGDEPYESGWVSPLNRALYPPRERWRDARPGPGCPRFGDRTVLSRPQRGRQKDESSVKPGLHVSEAGEEVVWWDPAKLQLDVPRNFGLRQEELLTAADERETATLDGLGRLRRWSRSREQLLEAGARPEYRVMTVSQTEEPPPDFRGDVELQGVERPVGRPSGRRFGTLVHTVLRDVDLDADDGAVERLARLHGRMMGADPAEVSAAADSVVRALAHPVLRRAAAAPRRHRETPFTLSLDGGEVVEGVLDLIFPEDGGWTVVDFKTDADVEALVERYRVQAAWYVLAARRLLDAPARAILLSV